MYKLLIEIENVWSVVDLGDDKPAMNYQANNIAELKNRQADYSQNLKLPPTKNNCQLFGNSDSFDVITGFPYQKHNCRLYSDDSILAGPGSFLILDKVTDSFEVQILSGNADLFTTLGNSKMLDLDLGSIIRNLASFDPVNFNKYCFAASTFLKGGSSVYHTNLDSLYPFVFIKPIIENILKSNGYNLPDGIFETNLLDDKWNKKALSICSINSSPDSLIMFDAECLRSEPVYWVGYFQAGIYRDNITKNANGNFSIVGSNLEYHVSVNCTMVLNFSIFGFKDTSSSLGDITIIIKNMTQDTELMTYSERYTLDDSVPFIFNATESFNEGDVIQVSITSSDNVKIQYSLSFSQMVGSTVPVGGKLYFAPNLGFDTQLDFFKMFVQLFGLTVSADNETKTVKAYTMQKLYDNKPIAKDWSKKLHDIKTNELNFQTLTASYGQSNFIRFDDNTDDNVKDSGSFLIQNNTLPITKDLFGIKLESGLDNIVSGKLVANIPLQEVDKDGVISFKGGKPHIVDISTGSTIDMIIYGSLFRYHIATHSKAQWFVDTFYPGLITMLSDAKYKIDEMYLTDQDIEESDPFIPVYIQKYGKYFYVNKINNYISKTLTKVELVKL